MTIPLHFQALASDYDGTLAHHGTALPDTLAAVDRLRASGRKFVLVTGRELEELKQVFPQIDICDLVVAENGALLYWPDNGHIKLLAEPAPQRFVDELKARRVDPIAVGRVIVATFEPHETAVLQAIKTLGLELEVIFNKGAVMVLPSGVNKATGLLAGLSGMGLSPKNVVGVGDAENDHAFLSICGCGVAVANALPTLKERASFVTAAPHGHGVAELIHRMLRDDLAEYRQGTT